MTNDERILLILDLDETLVHAREQSLSRPHDFIVSPYFVYKRPHLEAFLTACAAHFRIAIWSAASDEYVRTIVAQVFPEGVVPEFVWSRSRCVQRYDMESFEYYFVKDLRKVKRAGYALERILIVDDTPRKLERNYGNAIYVPSYVGVDDDILPRLVLYLSSIAAVPDVRAIEKRLWQRRVMPEDAPAEDQPGG